MKNLLKKMKSRKFITAIIGVIVGIYTMTIGDTNTVKEIAGLTATIASIMSYIIVEGRIDAKAVNQIADVVETAETVMKDKQY